jgi:hypothetical protein
MYRRRKMVVSTSLQNNVVSQQVVHEHRPCIHSIITHPSYAPAGPYLPIIYASLHIATNAQSLHAIGTDARGEDKGGVITKIQCKFTPIPSFPQRTRCALPQVKRRAACRMTWPL